ncbi:Short-chain dehydrogenase/reductase SDR [Pleurostoma richardsiae]|uniref:Short-chain dehydrogenase/reductase SDR n=1 Tax=Pleurostoma richardsiae TaxID=41990 RepID=A0AA38RR17_9PEZI|nr:Short-chain dehydrogenase/reductase SDR [Pleurostoma richardsiae]
MAPRTEPRLIIIGCGTAGIALAARLRSQLGYKNFVIYERENDVGGTWYLNTYPGVGCDVDSHLYSFSFNPNPDWSRRFADQAEILQYLHSTVDEFGVREHVQLRTEVVAATWLEEKRAWSVCLRDMETGHKFLQEAEMLVSCVGTISIPKDCDIPGHESYRGAIFHSARWNHDLDLRGKRVAVIGNGCSAAQLMPYVARDAAQVVQFQRSPQWINARPNPEFSEFRKWCFRNVPLYGRMFRFWVWKSTDALHDLYVTGSESLERSRQQAQREAEEYMRKTAPEEYLDMLIPTFPLGCKRRIFDPGYLECLHWPNVELTTERIVGFTETGLKTPQREIDFDAVVLSTGFKIQEFLSPIEVVGRDGKTLNDHWRDTRGAQAYRATFVHGFPNFGIVFGPNAFPAHNSVIFTNETQAEYVIKTLVRPVLRGSFDVLEVKQSAETRNANHVQERLKTMVWSGGCANWNLDASGRNTTNYHDPTWKFWWDLYWPVWADFDLLGGTGSLPQAPWTKLAVWTAVAGCLASGLSLASRHNLSLLQAVQ